MYEAKDNCVYYVNPYTNQRYLFLTVHETDSNMTPQQQAIKIAEIFNDL